MKKKFYIANALFTTADRDFNIKLYNILTNSFPNCEFYLPQLNDSINDKSNGEVTPQLIFTSDNEYLDASYGLIAVLDGTSDIDTGVACEIGRFCGIYEKEIKNGNRKVYGIYTDIRRDCDGDARFNINGYVKGAILHNGTIVDSVVSLVHLMKEDEKLNG